MKTTIMILAVAAASTVASAGTINTGVDINGVILGSNAPEIHFTLLSAPAGSTTALSTVNGLPSGTYYHTGNNIGTATADWIGIFAGFAGTYVFTETFTGISGFTNATWATDNCGSVTSSSGVLSGQTSIGAGQTLGTCDASTANFGQHFFSASGLNLAGTTLTFTLINNEGPVSLLFDAGTGVPEPASVLSVLTGLGLVGLGIRRRQSAK